MAKEMKGGLQGLPGSGRILLGPREETAGGLTADTGDSCVESRPDPFVRVGRKCSRGWAKGASPCLLPLLAAST